MISECHKLLTKQLSRTMLHLLSHKARTSFILTFAAPQGSKDVPADAAFCVTKKVPVNLNRIKKVPVNLNRIKKVPVNCNHIKKALVNCNHIEKVPVNWNHIKKAPVNCNHIKKAPVNCNHVQKVPVNYEVTVHKFKTPQTARNVCMLHKIASLLFRSLTTSQI